MSAKFFTPKGEPADEPWQWEKLHSPGKWKPGRSAKALAHCWTDAGGFPREVQKALDDSAYPALQNLRFECGYPECPAKLAGVGRQSMNDILVWARGNDGLVCITVEGKVLESFAQLVKGWRKKNPGENREIRLSCLLKATGLQESQVHNLRYQLLHRTASAIIFAKEKNGEKIECKNAVMLVHSFSQTHANFCDFADFARAYDGKINPQRGCIHYVGKIRNINLYLAWITGDEKYFAK